MTLPDQIFSIGGAGKDIGMEILESEWVLREVLQPRPDPETLTITFLDTASEEKNDDLERISDIRQKRDEIKEEYRESSEGGRVGDVKVRYKLITENIMLNSRIDLVGDDVVPRITSGTGIPEQNWWVSEKHIEENLNFAKGAVRKRGLGKAMYYKAYAEDDQLATMIDIPSKGEIAIISGIGGGTGSGLFIDVAQELTKKMPTADITLFGVLPNHTEGLRENANAFAALSELEWLSLTGNPLFKDRILMPIDPTGFDGKRGNRVESDQMIEEFDQAAVYLLLAYYNNQGMEDVFSGSPQFAPFTIGIPQILRYNVEAIQEARKSIENILNFKEDALDAERDIYEEVEIFLDSQYGEVDGGLRGEEESDLSNRLTTFESLLEFDLFEELEYESVNLFREVLADAAEESEEIGEQIDIIGGSLRAGVAMPNEQTTYADNVDAHLSEVLQQDLDLITRRKQILEQKSAIDNNRVRRAVESILGLEDAASSAGRTVRRLESQLSEAEEKRARLNEELAEAASKLESIREEQKEEVSADVSRWERDIEHHIEQLSAIAYDEIKRDLDSLQTALSQYRGEIVNSGSTEEVENVNPGEVNTALDSLEESLRPTGVSIEDDKRAIQRSLSELQNARKAYIHLEREESTLERLAPWDSSTKEEKQEAQKTFRMASNRLDDTGVFSVGPPSAQFSSELEYNPDPVLGKVEERQDELEKDIIDKLRDQLEEELPREVKDDLERELDEQEIDREACRDIARRVFENELDGTADIESRRENLNSRIENLDEDISLYESVIDLFESVSNRRGVFKDHQSSFQEALSDFDERSSRSVTTESEDYVYIKNVQPQQVFQATGSKTLSDTGLFNNRQELNRVRDNLEELANNTLDRQYTGLQRRKLSHNGRRYSDLRVRVAVLSEAVDQLESDTINLKSTYEEAFDLEGNPTKQRYSAWNADIGDDWDIGMAVFVDGVFFDNIRKAVQADGYASGYEEWATNPDVDIQIHHSLGLEDGHYVRRKGTLNVESSDDVSFLLQDESDVVDGLLQEWSEQINSLADDAPDGTKLKEGVDEMESEQGGGSS
ncbi:TolA-binding protein [Halarchaeum rubridurum]|uniref:TolA-binding protein n=1 Tax=Halarchaeum rubridurum TaxID=489911 RepID=A0A830G0N2_9EURY|nr:tubulin-like doman-containing protein [Halarchaeum rubridurum]MBP1955089.1 TolA-binding protein [Halarchaeum rubridurum]GGM69022.1 hypothetical protein GCM10009017_19060 [Halarchaeum rubridurum]